MNLEQLKYPIGKYKRPEGYNQTLLNEWINDIEVFPTQLKQAVSTLSDEQLDSPYRPDGWTIRQVVHHCADSHMNSFMRFKLTLTEDQPTIKPYFEDRWATLPDSQLNVEPSLKIIEGLHERWVHLLKQLTETDFNKTFTHPEHGRTFSLYENTAIYAWHCKHHLAHITTLKTQKG